MSCIWNKTTFYTSKQGMPMLNKASTYIPEAESNMRSTV